MHEYFKMAIPSKAILAPTMPYIVAFNSLGRKRWRLVEVGGGRLMSVEVSGDRRRSAEVGGDRRWEWSSVEVDGGGSRWRPMYDRSGA